MKYIITLIAIAMSLSAQANDLVAQYRYGVEKANNISYMVISLNKDSEIIVQEEIDNPAIDATLLHHGTIQLHHGTIQLHHEEVIYLNLLASQLSNAEITKFLSPVTCKIFVPFHMHTDDLFVTTGYDIATGDFNGVLRKVQGPRGCWVGYHLFPTDNELEGTASTLKSVLKRFALEIL